MTFSNTVVVFIPMKDKDIKKVIKKAVAEAIKLVGTQKKLADLSNLSQGAIGKYYRGEAKPTGPTAKLLEKAVKGKISKSRFAPHVYDEDEAA